MFDRQSEKINKNLMSVLGAILILFLAVLVISGAIEISNKIKEGKYAGQGLANKNTISVTGEGKIFIKPDLAEVSTSVFSESKNLASAQLDNTGKMNSVIDFLKNEVKIPDKDLKTTNYNINPQYEYTKDGKRVFIGYRVDQTLQIKIRDLAKVGDVLDGVVLKGANEINSLQFTLDDPEKPRIEARKLAIDNAKEKAKTLTSQLGVKLGKIISFNENAFFPTPAPYFKEAMGGAGGAAPQVQPGENEISVNVSITYEIR